MLRAVAIAVHLAALPAGLARADDRADDGLATPTVEIVPNESSRRAEIRRLLEPQGNHYLAIDARVRRSMSRDEVLRLREDLRNNRDVYETRERRSHGRR